MLDHNKNAAKDIINDIETEFNSTVSTLLKIVDSEELLTEIQKVGINPLTLCDHINRNT